MAQRSFDAIVIGGGPGGYVCGIRLGQLKQKVLVVEREEVGGVCLNWGCIPSKALISASHAYEKAKHSEHMGLFAENVRVDVTKMQDWKNGIVKKLTGGIRGLFKGNGVELAMGSAKLVGPKQVEITAKDGTKEIVEATKAIVIATGAETIELPAFKFDGKQVIGAREAVSLPAVPKRLAVIGGGVIGSELGGVYQALGSELTIIEATGQLLPGTEPELATIVEKAMVKRGAKVLKNAMAKSMERQADGSLLVNVEVSGAMQQVACDVLLVAVGMRPNTSTLGLEAAGVKVERGFVTTDSQGRTNVPHIYAIGDVSGGPLLAHKASKEGEVVAEVIAGHKAAKDWVAIPGAIFTHPEVGSMGLTEAQAKEKGIDVLVGTFPFAALGRALAVSETDGMFKVIADKKTHEVLGVHICGPSATDLISEGVLAVEMHAFLEDIGLSIHPHPTLGEGLMEASMAALGHAIHKLNK
jgi:dihydrolipoamide dehydrogenase